MEHKNLAVMIGILLIAVALGIALSRVHLVSLPTVPSPWSLLPRDTQIALTKTIIEGCQRVVNAIRQSIITCL